MICGTFNDMDDNPLPSPRRRKPKRGKMNPFASLGLDKFQTLLADLEEKKQKVYSDMGPEVQQERPTIKFVTRKEKGDIVPVVVKLKEKGGWSGELDGNPVKSSQGEEMSETDKKAEAVRKSGFQFVWNWRVRNFRQPSMYLPVALILILIMLMVFGRSMAVMCTSVGWYLFPLLTSKGSDSRREFGRKSTDVMASESLQKSRLRAQVSWKSL